MAYELATAYVSLSASAKGLGRDIENELGVSGAKGSKTFGSKFASGAGKVFKRVGKVGGAALAGVVGAALVKGFGRLKAIDDARAKLSGLGNSAADVDEIMNNALASVKGTAFGLGEAATVAASAVAAGISPGEELTGVLALVADAASIAGTDMASMGAIFNKVAASGKLQGDTIAQLQDQGIPIVQMLAKQMGISAEEVYALASAGKIGFDDFRQAMESGLGGAAQESGKTFSGALANMGAALGRLGAQVLEGVFPQLQGGFVDITKTLDSLGPAAERVGAVLGKALSAAAGWVKDALVPAMIDLAGKVRTAGQAVVDFGSWVQANEGKVKVIAGVITGLLLPAIVSLGVHATVSAAKQVAAWVVTSTAGTRSAIAQAAAGYKVVASWVMQGAAAVKSGAQTAYVWALIQADAIKGAAANVAARAKIVAGWVAQGLAAVRSGAQQVAAWAMIGLQAAKAGIMQAAASARAVAGLIAQRAAMIAAGIASKAMAAGQWLLNAALSANPIGLVVIAIAALVGAIVLAWKNSETFRTIVLAVWGAIKKGIAATVKWLTGTAWPMIKRVWDLVSAGVRAVAKVVSGQWKAIRSAISTAVNAVRSVVTRAWNAIRSTNSAVWNGIRSVITSVGRAIRSVVSGFANSVRSTISAAWNAARSLTSGAWSSIRSAASSGVSRVVGVVRGIPGRVTSALGNLGSLLYQSGARIIDGLVSGIRNGLGRVKDAVSSVLSAARDLLPFSPAKEGPFSGKGWTLYSGRAISEALAQGMTDRRQDVARAASRVVQAAQISPGAVAVGGVASSPVRASIAARQASGQQPLVYVENPWTGEYMLARTKRAAEQVVFDVAGSAMTARR